MMYKIKKYIEYVFKCMLGIIYWQDEKCLICESEVSEGSLLCNNCMDKIRFCSGKFNLYHDSTEIVCYSAAYYSNIIKEMVIRLKYKSDFACGNMLASFMTDIIRENNIKFDYITYVPSGKESLKLRGYNQAKYLAKCIGNKFDIRVENFLEKHKSTKDQIGLSSEMRWKNLKDSFKVLENKKINGSVILLVDDVITTGATIFYCTEKLMKSGAKQVIVLTAAKSKI